MSDQDRLLEHEYDGIHEYDNPLPGWWRAVFWGTIVFAAGYWIYFHVADKGEPLETSYLAELAHYDSLREVRAARDAANVSEEMLATTAHDTRATAHGAAVFSARCAGCHGDRGQGLIGPNLTDANQLHGASRMDLFTTVSKGVPGTAMVAWSEQLGPTDVIAVTAFVATLRGQNIAGKEPQGSAVSAFK
ncbi:MAG: cbb3-type cytochrome c oxidase N-terminal domain-containing protein [Kofleriaceae bacterium]|nr:cbb3-type cytochrome c oxidase N-terminal domain-containing protein [Kofleriaceae bacterium]